MGNERNGHGAARARGKNSIQLDFAHNGIRCRETLKLEPTKANLSFARNLLARIAYEQATGQFVYRDHFPHSRKADLFDDRKSTRQTVGTCLDTYLSSMRPVLATSTFNDYASAISHHLKPAFGDVPLTDLSTKTVREFIAGLVISPKRINNVLVPLRGMLADAFADGLIERNPMDRVKNLSAKTEEPDPFTPAERDAILSACDDPQLRNLFQFAFWTGLRTGELIAVEWADIDWISGQVRVRRSVTRKEVKCPKTKSGERNVLLLPPALTALKAQRQHTELLAGRIFHNPRTQQPWETDGQIRKTAWVRILRRAGVRYRYPYQMRHTYASTLLSAGENPVWVSQQMGHKDWGMLRKVYGRWIPEVNPQAGERIMELLDKAVTKL